MKTEQPTERWIKYRPTTTFARLGYLVEECGEVLAAIGKSQRWGLESVNPELPSEEQEKNGDWLLRELDDLDRASRLLRRDLRGQGYGSTL